MTDEQWHRISSHARQLASAYPVVLVSPRASTGVKSAADTVVLCHAGGARRGELIVSVAKRRPAPGNFPITLAAYSLVDEHGMPKKEEPPNGKDPVLEG